MRKDLVKANGQAESGCSTDGEVFVCLNDAGTTAAGIEGVEAIARGNDEGQTAADAENERGDRRDRATGELGAFGRIRQKRSDFLGNGLVCSCFRGEVLGGQALLGGRELGGHHSGLSRCIDLKLHESIAKSLLGAFGICRRSVLADQSGQVGLEGLVREVLAFERNRSFHEFELRRRASGLRGANPGELRELSGGQCDRNQFFHHGARYSALRHNCQLGSIP